MSDSAVRIQAINVLSAASRLRSFASSFATLTGEFVWLTADRIPSQAVDYDEGWLKLRAPSDDASKAHMAHARVDRLSMTRGGPVASAIVGCAEMRTPFDNLARNAGRVGIVTVCLPRPARILGNA